MASKGKFPALSSSEHPNTLYEHLHQFHQDLNAQLKACMQLNRKLPAEIYIRLLDSFEELKNKFCTTYNNKEITERLKVIQQESRELGERQRALLRSKNETINEITIAAVRQLKSGDLEITAHTEDDVNALALYAAEWIKTLREQAFIYQHTYGIVVNTIRTKALGAIRN
ncbi:hypothetical protein A1O3_09763 [Capronia epimyces CBS 606.96]|uniref:Uncharacterized protein n=1 Tax=Capronia epimyces CBS 606.96 TaxID=1182542 RepID=W9XKN8_9EURO|nr:uncharacterized protein A1O3_09763 [Capronia epimyces CBS 606.96]EXJ77536.1 hypothetical protein A1O3_09763 [Capronia epimyces CBS 606.96]